MAHHPRLVFFCPRVEDPADLLPGLTAALGAGRVDAVILPLPEREDRALVNFAKAFAPVVQNAGAALLLLDRPDLVVRSGADGAHLSAPDALAEALELLRPQERIVGCAGLRARHEAMEAAELGCEYVMFGEPLADGTLPPLPSVLERAAWWAELFQTPCVGYVPDAADIDAVAKTGAEFVAVGPAVFTAPEGPAAAVAAALAVLAANPLPTD